MRLFANEVMPPLKALNPKPIVVAPQKSAGASRFGVGLAGSPFLICHSRV